MNYLPFGFISRLIQLIQNISVSTFRAHSATTCTLLLEQPVIQNWSNKFHLLGEQYPNTLKLHHDPGSSRGLDNESIARNHEIQSISGNSVSIDIYILIIDAHMFELKSGGTMELMTRTPGATTIQSIYGSSWGCLACDCPYDKSIKEESSSNEYENKDSIMDDHLNCGNPNISAPQQQQKEPILGFCTG